VLALLLAASGAAPDRGGCGACPAGCPMHAGRLGCHETHPTRTPRCHRSAAQPGLRAGCGHAAERATVDALRGVLPAAPVVLVATARRHATSPTPAPPSVADPEPLPRPPRAVPV